MFSAVDCINTEIEKFLSLCGNETVWRRMSGDACLETQSGDACIKCIIIVLIKMCKKLFEKTVIVDSYWYAGSSVCPDLGEISPLWQFFTGLFSVGQEFEFTLANFNAMKEIFNVVNGQILKKYLAIWSH